MNLRSLLLTAAMAGLCAAASAQSGIISTMKFDHEVWDFGTIRELDGPVSHIFEFTNTGEKPFMIENISVSCGCTSPDFTYTPILPGEKGFVSVTYDPQNRPGRFTQEVHVKSNYGANYNVLRVKGVVEPKEPVDWYNTLDTEELARRAAGN